MENALLKRIEDIVERRKQIKKILKEFDRIGIDYEDATSEYGYPNVRIYTEDGGCIRIFKRHKRPGLVVWKYTPVELKWSGIPVFEPSGRRSF